MGVFPRRWSCVLVLVAVLCPAGARAQESLEYAVKATFLVKFPPFVRFPAVPGDHFTLCVVGTDPFGALLDRAAAGQTVDNMPLVIRRMPALTGPTDCRVVYAGGSPAQPVSAILAALRGQPVLSVTDKEVGNAAGIINFVIVNDRVRFGIDEPLAESDGLAISSKLLSLAVSTRAPP